MARSSAGAGGEIRVSLERYAPIASLPDRDGLVEAARVVHLEAPLAELLIAELESPSGRAA